MTTGIIYKATNLITNKVYIGQTTKSLKERIRGHYKAVNQNVNCKFPNALRKYNKEEWCWEIIENAVPIEELDDKEAYYISHFNSYYSGYNSTLYSNSTRGLSHNHTIYELFKPEYGIIKGTRCDLIKINNKLERLNNLVSGKVHHVNGFVLAVNTDKYKEIQNILTLEHPIHGKYKLPAREFTKQFGLKTHQITRLKIGLSKSTVCGWKLVIDI